MQSSSTAYGVVRAFCGWSPSLVALALLMPGTASAQAQRPYAVNVAPGTYQPLPIGGGTATSVSASSMDDGAVSLTSPFPITFFGQTYNSLYFVTNGFVTFGSSSTTTADVGFPNASTPNNLIAPWWDDLDCRSGTLKHQTIGAQPNRQFVLQWECSTYNVASSVVRMQLWFTEGSTTLQAKYGGPITAVRLDHASIGIENSTGTVGYVPFPCGATGTCQPADFPANKVITYAQGPDVTVTSVTGEPIAYAGVTTHMEAVATNVGGQDANGIGMRFWVSTDDTLSAGDIAIGVSANTADLAPGQSATFVLDAPLPTNLVPGAYYLLAEADPLNAVAEDNEANNVGAYGSFDVGLPAPDLIVEAFAGPTSAKPGVTLPVEWTVRNVGNLRAGEVPWVLLLSTNDVVTPSDRVIYEGTLSVEALTSVPVLADVPFPSDVPAGTYWLGVAIDPEQLVFELDDTNNEGVSDNELTVGADVLEIETTTLPPAEVGAPYCTILRARGGDGRYTFAVIAGELPPGLALEEMRDGVPAGEPPLVTRLCGTPSARGTFAFTLQVASAGFSAAQAYEVVVDQTGMPLTASTTVLQQAIFRRPYEEQLAAVGGVAPYAWSLVDGALPPGIVLFRDGSLRGTPTADGSFRFTAEVVDAAGASARVALDLPVSSPVRLDCVTDTLPTSRIDEALTVQLVAAGGKKPYTWKTGDSRRLANGLTDDGQRFDGPPPGFRVDENGKVTARPRAAGRYAWDVVVTDGANASDTCTLSFDVAYEQGVTVATTALPSAIADAYYEAQLRAVATTGAVQWSLAEGSFLPEGLELSATGGISGTVPAFVLEGAKARTFSFLVRVADESNKGAVQALSIEVLAESAPRGGGTDVAKEPEGGCAAGAAAPGLLGIGLALALLRRRR